MLTNRLSTTSSSASDGVVTSNNEHHHDQFYFTAVTAFIPSSLSQSRSSPSQRQLLVQQQRRLYHHHHHDDDGRFVGRDSGSSFLKSRCFSSANVFASSLPTPGLFMTAMEDQEQDQATAASTTTSVEKEGEDRKWNLGGLRKEVSRLTVRCHKKIGKANQRIQKAKEEVERLLSKGDDTITDEEFDSCPNIDQLEQDLATLKTRLQQLDQLEVLLQDIKGNKAVVLPDHISSLVLSLQVNDEPLTSNPQSPSSSQKKKKKEKGPKNMTSFRRPYRRYYTMNKTEIRVGKQAEDNDELSLNPDHRDSLDWWMQ